jgi:hypothetical protein
LASTDGGIERKTKQILLHKFHRHFSSNSIFWAWITSLGKKISKSDYPIDEHVQLPFGKIFGNPVFCIMKDLWHPLERPHMFNHFHREWYEIMNHWWQVIFDKYHCRDMQPQKNEMLVIESTSSTKWVTLMSWKVHKGLYLFYYPMDRVQIWKC